MKGTVEGREGHLVFPDYPGCSDHGTSQMLSLVVAYLLLARSPLIDTIIFNRNQLLDTFDKNICVVVGLLQYFQKVLETDKIRI